jgi:hypothetical protein
MKANFSYFIVTEEHVLSLTDAQTSEDFIDWVRASTQCIRLPWGDLVYSLEAHVVEDDEYKAQEEVFLLCNLAAQNLVYELKQLQLKEDPDSKAELVFQ